MDSVIVEDVTVKKDGPGKSVNIHIHVQCQLKKVLRNAKEILIYLALDEVSTFLEEFLWPLNVLPLKEFLQIFRITNTKKCVPSWLTV